MKKIETLILSNLIYDEEFLRTAIPHIEDAYFTDWAEQRVFKQIKEFVLEYNAPPTKEALLIVAQDDTKLAEDQFESVSAVIDSLEATDTNKKWLNDQTEKFCQDKALYNAIVHSIKIIDGKDDKLEKDAIPELLKDALGVSFCTSIGHDYIEDSESRYEFYHRVESRVPFDLEMFNKITRGGLPKKTLNICLAGINVGKSLLMCHMAASNLEAGNNVLYITLEMAEERIAERIDANLMNVPMEDLPNLPQKMFDDRITRIKNKTEGRLVIKEYPTVSAHAGHFRGLLNELQLKKDFSPDIIFIDYINICASQRFKASSNLNSYTLVKGIAEELRGLAVEFDVPIMSATQITRSGFSDSDVDMTDTAESFGLPATCDFMFALITTEALEQMGQLLVKQLKSRYGDKSRDTRFLIGVDKSKMRLYDLDDKAQRSVSKIADSAPVSVSSDKFSGRGLEEIKF